VQVRYDGFLAAWKGEVQRLDSDTLDTGSLPSTRPLAVVIAPPSAQTQ
jgi:hypothetical protein